MHRHLLREAPLARVPCRSGHFRLLPFASFRCLGAIEPSPFGPCVQQPLDKGAHVLACQHRSHGGCAAARALKHPPALQCHSRRQVACMRGLACIDTQEYTQAGYRVPIRQPHPRVYPPPSLPSKRIRNRARDGPRNAMPELAPPVGPRFCHLCHVESSPTPRRGSPSHGR